MLFRQPTIVLHRVETFPFAASHFCLSYTELLFLSDGTLLWVSCCQKLPVTVQSTQAYRQEIFYLFILLLFFKWHRLFSSLTNISWFPLNIYLEGGKGEPTSSGSRSAYNTLLLTCVYQHRAHTSKHIHMPQWRNPLCLYRIIKCLLWAQNHQPIVNLE